jgi:RND family efflux transporter MFP subunit
MTAKNGSISLILKLALALAVIAAVAFVALQRFSETVAVEPVRRGKAVSAVPGSVTVYADKGIREFKSDLPGRVENCDALDPERPFKKGDVLLKLDSSDLQREIDELKRNFESGQAKRKLQLEANIELKVAKENLATAERLQLKGDVSAEQVKNLRRVLDATESKFKLEEFDNDKAKEDFKQLLESKKRQLEKMSIVALEDGVVEGVTVWRGALIGSGAPVATFSSATRIVEAKISEENIGSIHLDQKARVRLLIYPGEVFDAKVVKIFSSAEESTQRYRIHLDVAVKPERLRHGSTGQVTITVGERDNQPLIPRRALFNGKNLFVVKDGRVQLREIELGFISLSAVEVTKGLTEGELVIVENIDTFRDGQRVRIPAAK